LKDNQEEIVEVVTQFGNACNRREVYVDVLGLLEEYGRLLGDRDI